MFDAPGDGSDHSRCSLRVIGNGVALAAMLAAGMSHGAVAEDFAISAGELTVEFRGLPSPGMQAGPVRFGAGGIAGYVEEVAMLAGKTAAVRVGMSGLFVELGSTVLPIPEGLRIHAANVGVEVDPDLNAVTGLIARDVSLAGRPGSDLERLIGRVEAGDSLASIGRIDLVLPYSLAAHSGSIATRPDEFRLMLGDIRLAKTLLARGFSLAGLPPAALPAFSADVAARVSGGGQLDAAALVRLGNVLEFRLRIRNDDGRLMVEVEMEDAGDIPAPRPSVSDSAEYGPGDQFGESGHAPGGRESDDIPAGFDMPGSENTPGTDMSGMVQGRGLLAPDHVPDVPVVPDMVGFGDSRD